MEITRPTFTLAIEHGIKRAGDLLFPEEVARLQHVAANATSFDTNFAVRTGVLNVGCPGSQASLSEGASWQFACGFDDYFMRVLDFGLEYCGTPASRHRVI